MKKIKLIIFVISIGIASFGIYYYVKGNKKEVVENYDPIKFKYKSEIEKEKIKREIAKTYEENYMRKREIAIKKMKNNEQKTKIYIQNIEKKIKDIDRLKVNYIKADEREKREILALFSAYIGNEDYVIAVLDELEAVEKNREIKLLIQSRLVMFYKETLKNTRTSKEEFKEDEDYNLLRNRYIEFMSKING